MHLNATRDAYCGGATSVPLYCRMELLITRINDKMNNMNKKNKK